VGIAAVEKMNVELAQRMDGISRDRLTGSQPVLSVEHNRPGPELPQTRPTVLSGLLEYVQQ
jgi:hypothetical protein